jgi:large subunit ribosomal protein L3
MQLNSLIGKKTYQKQGFLQDGRRVPLSGVLVAGNFVTQLKTQDNDGYNALQLGIGIKKRAKKRTVNHIKKAGLENTPRFFREIRVDDLEGASAGAKLNVNEIFQPGDIVNVTGISKGKGFAGGVKRHNFKGGPRTHGQSDRERAPGSIGQTTTPGRVYKGKRMAGRMGQDTVTVKNLEIIEITNDGMLLIKGLVPGSLNSILTIKKVGENKKFVPLYKEEEPVQENLEADSKPQEEVSEPKEEEGVEPAKQEEVKEEKEEEKVEVSEATEKQPEEIKEEQPENENEVKEEEKDANS